MAEATLDYDEFLDGTGGKWKRRLIIASVAFVIAAAAAFFAWKHWMRGGSEAAAPEFTEGTVATGNVTKTISTSGTVSAEKTSNLNFSSSGKVTSVNVALGQQVKDGDVLATIDPTSAQNSLRTAQAGLASAQARLTTLLQGSTASELASADQSVSQAQASYDKAVQALATLKEPPAATDIEAAQQGVTSAQAKLQTAVEARLNLNKTAADDVAKAQDNLSDANSGLTSAQQALDDANSSLSTAQGALYNLETSYCPDAGVSFCSVHMAPLSSSDASALLTVSTGSDPVRGQAAQSVLTANDKYRAALSARDKASAGVTSANKAVTTAQSALTDAQGEPSAAQIATANAGVTGAQSDLDAANKKLSDLQVGPAQQDLNDAQGAIDQANVALIAAKAKRDETYAGSTASDIASQRSAVEQAQVSVDNAQKTVDDTQLTAPFDGTVAALNVQVGDIAGSGSGSSGSSGTGTTAAIVLNTPDLVVLNLTVSETDYPNVKVGNTGTATFEALPNQVFPFTIDSLGVNPTTTQGVVTYQAKAHLLTGAAAASALGALRPSGAGNGATGRGPAATQADATPGANTTPRAAATPGVDVPGAGAGPGAGRTRGLGQQGAAAAATGKPAPGMNATVTIVVDQRSNVTTVPAKAVQARGRESYVTVKNDDGTTQDVTVTTGLSDTTNTEITSGLTEGQTIEIPGKATTTSTTQALPATGNTGGGFRFGGGGGGGGGAGGGGAGAGGGRGD